MKYFQAALILVSGMFAKDVLGKRLKKVDKNAVEDVSKFNFTPSVPSFEEAASFNPINLVPEDLTSPFNPIE